MDICGSTAGGSNSYMFSFVLDVHISGVCD